MVFKPITIKITYYNITVVSGICLGFVYGKVLWKGSCLTALFKRI